MKRKIISVILLAIVIYFLAAKNVSAVTTSISNMPQTISTDPFSINVTISGAGAGANYLRIDLYKPSATNYFGETFNGSSWYGQSDHSQYYSITIQSGTDWSGEIQGRVGNPTSTEYDGPGTYKMRVRRYTSSGSYSSTEANNNAVDVTINVELSSPTPTENPSPTENQSLPPTPTEVISEFIPPTSNLQPQTYNNVYISEAMIDPDSGSNEWVEFYNANDFQVNLESWYIDDVENGGTTPKKFSLIINAKSYATFDLSSSMFNNDGDSLRLLDFNQQEKDSFQYQSSEKGKSWGRTSLDNNIFCLQNPSKGTANNPCLNPASSNSSRSSNTLIPTPAKSPTITPSAKISQTRTVTISPTSYFFAFGSQPIIGISPFEEENGEVLGELTQNPTATYSRNHALLLSLSFASFSYSLLAMISIVLKLKRTVAS